MQIAIENEQALSSYVSHALRGEDVVLTEHGRPVARIVAAPLPDKDRGESVAAIRRLMQAGMSLGGQPLTRDELYERD